VTYLEWPGDSCEDSRKLDKFWRRLQLSMPKKRGSDHEAFSSSTSSSSSSCKTSSTDTSVISTPTSMYSSKSMKDSSHIPSSNVGFNSTNNIIFDSKLFSETQRDSFDSQYSCCVDTDESVYDDIGNVEKVYIQPLSEKEEMELISYEYESYSMIPEHDKPPPLKKRVKEEEEEDKIELDRDYLELLDENQLNGNNVNENCGKGEEDCKTADDNYDEPIDGIDDDNTRVNGYIDFEKGVEIGIDQSIQKQDNGDNVKTETNITAEIDTDGYLQFHENETTVRDTDKYNDLSNDIVDSHIAVCGKLEHKNGLSTTTECLLKDERENKQGKENLRHSFSGLDINIQASNLNEDKNINMHYNTQNSLSSNTDNTQMEFDADNNCGNTATCVDKITNIDEQFTVVPSASLTKGVLIDNDGVLEFQV